MKIEIGNLHSHNFICDHAMARKQQILRCVQDDRWRSAFRRARSMASFSSWRLASRASEMASGDGGATERDQLTMTRENGFGMRKRSQEFIVQARSGSR